MNKKVTQPDYTQMRRETMTQKEFKIAVLVASHDKRNFSELDQAATPFEAFCYACDNCATVQEAIDHMRSELSKKLRGDL